MVMPPMVLTFITINLSPKYLFYFDPGRRWIVVVIVRDLSGVSWVLARPINLTQVTHLDSSQ